jgi:hypothetical protein
MTLLSFTLGGVDVTDPVSDTAVWWGCADCHVDVELTAADLQPTCPDCSGPLRELWRWELRAA